MKKIFTKEVVIGLCVLIALAVLYFGINFLRGVNIFKATNYYYASFTNVEGLAQSAPVTLNGFQVGHVRSIQYEYDNPGHVLVELSLDKQLKVPQGSEATMVTGLLGTATIELHLTDSAEYYSVGDKLVSVNKPSLLDAVGSTLGPAADNILPKIDELMTNLNAITGDTALLLAVKRLDGITADLERTTRSLSAFTSQLPPVATDVKQITGNATAISSDLAQVSSQLREVPIDSLVANLQATTENLKALTEQLNDPNSTLGLLLNDPALYNNLNTTVSSLDSLFVDIKRNPKRYVSIKVF